MKAVLQARCGFGKVAQFRGKVRYEGDVRFGERSLCRLVSCFLAAGYKGQQMSRNIAIDRELPLRLPAYCIDVGLARLEGVFKDLVDEIVEEAIHKVRLNEYEQLGRHFVLLQELAYQRVLVYKEGV
jgi:hypothetical protein